MERRSAWTSSGSARWRRSRSAARAGARPGLRRGQAAAALLQEPAFAEIVGMDVSHRALAGRAAAWSLAACRGASASTLLHGSLTYRDRRLEGYDAAAVVEVIEHLDPPRLRDFERVLFGAAARGRWC